MRAVSLICALPFELAFGVACTSASTLGDAGPSESDGQAAIEASVEGGLTCGNRVCPKSEVCCVDPATVASRCLPRSVCQGVGVTCLSVADCPSGQVCCASFQASMFDVVCSSQCTGWGNYQFCLTDAECPAGLQCSKGALVRVCAAPFAAAPALGDDAGTD